MLDSDHRLCSRKCRWEPGQAGGLQSHTAPPSFTKAAVQEAGSAKTTQLVVTQGSVCPELTSHGRQEAPRTLSMLPGAGDVIGAGGASQQGEEQDSSRVAGGGDRVRMGCGVLRDSHHQEARPG